MKHNLTHASGWFRHPHPDSPSARREPPAEQDLPVPAVDLHPEGVFLSYRGQTLRYLVGPAGAPLRFRYRHEATDREFDVRELPAIYFGPYRVAVMHGDRDAHRTVIAAAINAAYAFRCEQLCA
jgi:hypothetical protein